jgi:hypothetical protein
MIPVEDILFLISDEKYTRVQTALVEALIRKPIKELVDELDPKVFWQIHRSTLVNVNFIGSVQRDFRGRQVVVVRGPLGTLGSKPIVRRVVQGVHLPRPAPVGANALASWHGGQLDHRNSRSNSLRRHLRLELHVVPSPLRRSLHCRRSSTKVACKFDLQR